MRLGACLPQSRSRFSGSRTRGAISGVKSAAPEFLVRPRASGVGLPCHCRACPKNTPVPCRSTGFLFHVLVHVPAASAYLLIPNSSLVQRRQHDFHRRCFFLGVADANGDNVDWFVRRAPRGPLTVSNPHMFGAAPLARAGGSHVPVRTALRIWLKLQDVYNDASLQIVAQVHLLRVHFFLRSFIHRTNACFVSNKKDDAVRAGRPLPSVPLEPCYGQRVQDRSRILQWSAL